MATTREEQPTSASKEITLQAPEAPKLNHSERFTNRVLSEFGSNVAGAIQMSDYQRQLIQGYFIAIDRTLKIAEESHIRKNENNSDHKYDELLPVTWEYGLYAALVRMGATDVDCYVARGLTDKQKKKIMIADNRIYDLGEDDRTVLDGFLHELEGDLDIPGFDDDELNALLADFGTTHERYDDNFADSNSENPHVDATADPLIANTKPDSEQRPKQAIRDCQEIDTDAFSPQNFAHECPRCHFLHN